MPLFAVCCSLFAVRCSLFAVRCSLFARARDEEMLIRDSRRRRGADYPREV
jgi:hypothetical protein